MNRLSIRWRLTLWYGAVLAAVLVVFGATVYVLMSYEMRNRTGRELAIQAELIEDQLNRAQDRSLIQERLERLYGRNPEYDIQVSGDDGAIRLRSHRILGRGLPTPSRDTRSMQAVYQYFSIPDEGHFQMVSRRTAAAGEPLLIQVATSLAENEKELGDLLAILLLAGPLALGCTLGGGYLLARKALAPVNRMAAIADEITATRLDRRLHTPNPDDELGRLARTLNGMIARLERSFSEVRRFTADAAHELRTPLAILRNEAEVALRLPRDSDDYRESLENMLEEIEHLSQLSEALLILFREDAGLEAHSREAVRLDQLVQEMADDMRVVATEQGQRLVSEAGCQAVVMGSADQLRRLLCNLLDNAIKFTPAGGTVRIRVDCQKNQVRVSISDTGIGIAPEHLPKIFDRFYRVDSARSRTAGNGLGLSICRSITEAHQGRIEVESQPFKGTRVVVTLPGVHDHPPKATELEVSTPQGA